MEQKHFIMLATDLSELEKKKRQNKGNTEIKYWSTLHNPDTFLRTHAFEASQSSGSTCYMDTEADSNENKLSFLLHAILMC